MQLLRNLVSLGLWAVVLVWTVLLSVVVLTLSIVLWPIDRTRRVAQYVVTFWGHAMFLAHPLWRLRVHGREHLREGGPFIVCVNHQSYVDVTLLSALHAHWKWIAKRELFLLPFFGWAMWAIGNVSVRRGDKKSGENMIAACKDWLDRGASILIFPEGTRSKDGELQAFKHGAFTIAIAARRPILPIVVDGAHTALGKGGIDVTRSAKLVVSVLPPIDVVPYADKNDVEGLRLATREVMARELARLRAS